MPNTNDNKDNKSLNKNQGGNQQDKNTGGMSDKKMMEDESETE